MTKPTEKTGAVRIEDDKLETAVGGMSAGKVQMQDLYVPSRGSDGDDPMSLGSRRIGDDFGG